MLRIRPIILGIGTALLSLGLIITAQTGGECPALVEQALTAMGENCGGLDRNSGCYGYNLVSTGFTEPVDESYFNTPSDRTELAIVERIQTAPLDLAQENWGIATMSIQANIPGTLPGQAVTFLLLGDSEVENRTPPEAISEDVEPVEVIANTRAFVRSGDGLQNNVLGVLNDGDSVLADAINDAGDWVRVGFRGEIGWMNTVVLEANPAIESLPTNVGELHSPMQAFYFSTGVGEPQCNEAPDVVGIHSPEGLTVDLNVNGVNINVGSTISLKQISPTLFTITVHEGRVEAETGEIIFSNQTLVGRLSEDGTFIEWVEERPATEEERGYGDLLFDAFGRIGISIDAGSVQPIVGTTCTQLRPTSPLTGLGYGVNSFFWDAQPGATSYRVTVYNFGESRSVSFETQGDETFVSGNLTVDTIGGGFDNFAWEVQALRDGQVLCTGATVENLQRASDPNAGVVAGPAFTANWTCGGPASYAVVVNWSNLPPSETVTITFLDGAAGAPVNSGALSGASGSWQSPAGTAYPAQNGSATTSGGTVINLPGDQYCP